MGRCDGSCARSRKHAACIPTNIYAHVHTHTYTLLCVNCAISLQRGHIYTSFGSFFIEPVEPYTANNPSVLHRITRMLTNAPATPAHGPNDSNDSDDKLVAAAAAADDAAPAYQRSKRSLLAPGHAIAHHHHAHHQQTEPNMEYTMEVLVGVDPEMQDYHHEDGRNLKEYVLTLMGTVRTVRCAQQFTWHLPIALLTENRLILVPSTSPPPLVHIRRTVAA